jgi:hypothetical protein
VSDEHKVAIMGGLRAIAGLGVFAALCGTAEAAATAEGAKALVDSYAAYLSREAIDEGIVAVAPRDDDYVVTWDLQKAIDRAPPSDDKVRIDPFSYVLSPGTEGGWAISADKFPSIGLDVANGAGRMIGRIDVVGFSLKSVYDSSATEWSKTSLGGNTIAMKFHFTDPGQGEDESFAVASPALDVRARNAAYGSGVDVAAAYQNATVSGSITVPNGAETAPMTVAIGSSGDTGTYAIEGLRGREIGDFWKFVVARADATPSTPPSPDELRSQLGAILPGWRRLGAELTDNDFTVTSPLFSASTKSFQQSFAISGLTSEGGAQFGLKIADLSFASPVAPEWFASVVPASFAFDSHLALRDLDKIAELALADSGFGSGDLTPETREKMGETLLAGHPTLALALAPGRFKTPLIEVAFQGDISVDPTAPGGKVVISADSLDKTAALLQEISPTLPAAREALLGLAFVKGLATTDPTGRLVWEIEVKHGDVTVNGTPMPKGSP